MSRDTNCIMTERQHPGRSLSQHDGCVSMSYRGFCNQAYIWACCYVMSLILQSRQYLHHCWKFFRRCYAAEEQFVSESLSGLHELHFEWEDVTQLSRTRGWWIKKSSACRRTAVMWLLKLDVLIQESLNIICSNISLKSYWGHVSAQKKRWVY